ncbi:hypothetical protein CDAR_607111 [Caerostris darwini]|uniref:Uncharacterized protein n=1 Tax=Caerostris darwini TaxID=1538125 RepID=A0AAV4TDD2_9ARAC|nr:hypothetical protein CDAR_607111 [Caerostris darwini]
MFFVPSLQHMAYSKIAVILCNQADMKAPFDQFKALIVDTYYGPFARSLPSIISGTVRRAKQKIKVLRIPEELKPELFFVLKSTVLLIFKWFMDHSDILESDFGDVSSFQWRSDGTIEGVRTARGLVRRGDAPATMHRRFASPRSLEKVVLKLRIIGSHGMVLKRAEFCLWICIYWLRGWQWMKRSGVRAWTCCNDILGRFVGLAALQLASTHGEPTVEIYVETGLLVLTSLTERSLNL